MTLENKLTNLKQAIQNEKPKKEVLSLYNEYDKIYRQTPKENRNYQEYVNTYFLFLDYINRRNK